MLYYLFDITVTVEANEVKETFSDIYPVEFPDGTEQAIIEADAQDFMDEASNHYNKIFYYIHHYTKTNVQTSLEAYRLTEEEYNHFYTAFEEEE